MVSETGAISMDEDDDDDDGGDDHNDRIDSKTFSIVLVEDLIVMFLLWQFPNKCPAKNEHFTFAGINDFLCWFGTAKKPLANCSLELLIFCPHFT